jgi:hypothetical protein
MDKRKILPDKNATRARKKTLIITSEPKSDVTDRHERGHFFLSPNTISLLQPMDQEIIETSKAYYTRKILEHATAKLQETMCNFLLEKL